MGRSGVRLCVLSLLAHVACSPPPPPKPEGREEPAHLAEDDAPPLPGDPRLPGVARFEPALEARLREALVAAGSELALRTKHLRPDGSPKYVNRLVLESSPYLLQHAFNPVNFFAWGKEAFERARALDRPILLSVGYSTCHWCHVMERESFDDEEIAAYINQHYVAIKVDREERPDIDDIYMRAVSMLTGRGGWPMTVILTPDRQPFFGGTYFPARDGDRGASKGLLSILREMRQRYAEERSAVVAQARQVSERVQQAAQPSRPGDVPGPDALVRTAAALASIFDAELGGFGAAPKFPQPGRLGFLARYYRRTRDPDALQMLTRTLGAMAEGGIYDHVGGGFHRYSTDARWLVPHFEKMLYDNAQLAIAYLEGYQLTGEPAFARVATETLDYVVREMTSEQGAFYSATDADSEVPGGALEEGYYFTWTPAEVAAALDERAAALVSAHFGVSQGGNFEGRNILHVSLPLSEVASQLGLTPEAASASLGRAREVLYRKRRERPPPGVDDKVLTAWNGLMISAFARGAIVLGRDDYARAASRASDALLDAVRDERGRLLRSYRQGRARHNAYLDDHAFLVQALLDVHEATGRTPYLTEAIAIQKVQDMQFLDRDGGGYFATSDDHEPLLSRDKPGYDGALPSGNAVSLMNLLRLSVLTGDAALRERAERGFSAFASEIERGGRGLTRMLEALDFYLDVPLEVILVRPPGDDAEALRAVVRGTFLPNRVLLDLEAGAVEAAMPTVPLLEGKAPIGGKATAFVCERGRCELPTSDPKVLARQLAKVRPLLEAGQPPRLKLGG